MRLLVISFFITSFCFAQVEYPKDYFRSPLDIPLILSGTFGELRTNHFHSGLDIKTQQREGLKIYAIAEGYVSRIRVQHYGYGKAVYITHPNGYTSVYGHLQRFSPKIEACIKALQYKNESYEAEIFLGINDITVSKDEIIAYSGNTGSSGGPHLHFEIRDKNEHTINPLLFGLEIKDSQPPLVHNVYAYTFDDTSHVNNIQDRVELRIIPTKTNEYKVENIKALGTIGFGVVSYDKQDLATNQNGVNGFEAFFNGNKTFEMDFNKFSFDESRHINRFIDYQFLKTKKSRIQKLFVEKGNNLSMYKNLDNNGFVQIDEGTSSVYKFCIKDFHGNDAWVTIPITGAALTVTKQPITEERRHYIFAHQATDLKEKNVSVYIPANSFYDDTLIDFRVNNDTLYLDKDEIPLFKNITITYDISHYQDTDKDKLYIAELLGYKKLPSHLKTKRTENTITASSNALGTYALVLDTVPPVITPVNFQNGKWISSVRYLKLKVEDALSGISNYRATINGKFILMEYEYKTKTLTFDFNDKIVTDTKNELKLIVTDNVGNSSTFEATFFRK